MSFCWVSLLPSLIFSKALLESSRLGLGSGRGGGGQLADWEVTQKWSLSGAKEWEGGPRDTAGSPRAHPTLRPSEGASPPSL